VRVKDHLRARGVEFDAFNIASDPEAAQDVQGRGIRSVPVVALADDYVVGWDTAQVDALLGMGSEHVQLLPGAELVARAVTLLAAAARYAQQLPLEHHDDSTPGMEPVRLPVVMPGGTVLAREDGRYYVPHATNIQLARHAVGHGLKFLALAQEPDADYSDISQWILIGEPDDSLDVRAMGELAAQMIKDVHAWWDQIPNPDLERLVSTDWGMQSLHRLLHSQVYSMTQHTRQLMSVLVALGVEPDGPLGAGDHVGLQLPDGTWE
jgi:glutaredoxin